MLSLEGTILLANSPAIAPKLLYLHRNLENSSAVEHLLDYLHLKLSVYVARQILCRRITDLDASIAGEEDPSGGYAPMSLLESFFNAVETL